MLLEEGRREEGRWGRGKEHEDGNTEHNCRYMLRICLIQVSIRDRGGRKKIDAFRMLSRSTEHTCFPEMYVFI